MLRAIYTTSFPTRSRAVRPSDEFISPLLLRLLPLRPQHGQALALGDHGDAERLYLLVGREPSSGSDPLPRLRLGAGAKSICAFAPLRENLLEQLPAALDRAPRSTPRKCHHGSPGK